jgi:hypothetical protein
MGSLCRGSFHEVFHGECPHRTSSSSLVLVEVDVVLDVEGGERQVAGEAVGGDPRVVGRPGTAAELGVGLDLARSASYG